MSDWWNQPTRPTVAPGTSSAEPPLSCPWCAQPALPGPSHCSNCGAVMAQHEDFGGLAIPGVTVVDPAMQARGYTSSLIGSQSRMSTLSLLSAAPGGTVIQVAAAAAMLASNSSRGFGDTVDPEQIGKPSQSAIDMSMRLRHFTVPVAASDPSDHPTAQPDEPGVGGDVTGGSR